LKLRVNSRVLTYTSLSSSNPGNPTAATARKPFIDSDEIGCESSFILVNRLGNVHQRVPIGTGDLAPPLRQLDHGGLVAVETKITQFSYVPPLPLPPRGRAPLTRFPPFPS